MNGFVSRIRRLPLPLLLLVFLVLQSCADQHPIQHQGTPVPMDSPEMPVPVEEQKEPVPIELPKTPVPVDPQKAPVLMELPKAPVPVEPPKTPVTNGSPEESEPLQPQPLPSVQTGPAHTLYAKANEALASGLPGQAEMLLERALRIEPRNALYWHLLGQSKYAQGDFVQAVQLCRKSESLAGNNSKLRQNNRSLLQQAYGKLGDTELAEKFSR